MGFLFCGTHCIYNTLVLPHLNYCIILWGRCNKYLLGRLHKLQKRAIRIITNSSFLSHSKHLFIKTQNIAYFSTYEYNLGIFMFLYHKELLPDLFNSVFVKNMDIHNYDTRTKSHIRVNYGRTNFHILYYTGVNPGGGGGDGGMYPPTFLGGGGGGWPVQTSPPPHFLKIR